MTANPPWVRHTGMVAVGLVATVAAVVSYVHMHTLADRAGEGWRAWLEPLSVDGLLVGSSLVLLTKRRAGWLAWASLTIGLLVSLAANLAAARQGWVPHLVAAWPAVALALSYETLLSLLRQAHQAGEQGKPGARQVAGANLAKLAPGVAPELAAGGFEDGADDSEHVFLGELVANDASLESQARQLIRQARQVGRQVGRNRLADELGIKPHQARQLLDVVRDD